MLFDYQNQAHIKATECFTGKLASINEGLPYPALVRSPPNLERATLQPCLLKRHKLY